MSTRFAEKENKGWGASGARVEGHAHEGPAQISNHVVDGVGNVAAIKYDSCCEGHVVNYD